MAVTVMPASGRANSLLRSLFGSPLNIALTIGFALLLWATLPFLVRWAILDAAVFPALPETCRAASGACWSFIIAKHSQILFGIYP